jgi:hypothetical protein
MPPSSTRRTFADHLLHLLHTERTSARAALDARPPEEADVHEARKHLKKIRAVWRLFEEEPDYDTVERRLRHIVHGLSPSRDAAARIEALEALRRHYSAVITRAVAADIDTELQHALHEPGTHARSIKAAAHRLRKWQATLPRRRSKRDLVATVLLGVTRGYRRVRSAMRDLSIDASSAEMHRWRRRVKTHAYQLQALAHRHAAPHARMRRLKHLELTLGEDHDLALLRDALLDAPRRFGTSRHVALVLGCIVRRQTSLRARALALGATLFEDAPHRFARDMKRWSRKP